MKTFSSISPDVRASCTVGFTWLGCRKRTT